MKDTGQFYQDIVLTTPNTLRQIFVEALKEHYEAMSKYQQTITIEAPEKLHSIRELADFLKVSITTAQHYKNSGLPCIQYGRKVIFDTDSVLKWLSSKSSKKNKKLVEVQ